MESNQLLGYLQQGIDELLAQGGFDGGQEFRRTQKQALEAYQRYLSDDTLAIEEKLKGFFEIPTGVGKTAVFVGVVSAAQKAAQAGGQELKTVIAVPTLPLLNQTLEAFQGNGKKPDEEGYFAGFAPWLKNKIGLYGGRKKNLKLPFTIMTYDAWALRLEDGTLKPDDVDVLITDEAHRGTSDNRIDLAALFNDLTTLKVAFTATAEFDDDKSVYNSHERRIFYKPVAESILERELAAYVSSQRYGIRVDPDDYMLSDEFQEASFERKWAYRQAAKENAWNNRMLKIFRDGTDQKTGDPLSDNQAGFFVEGIRQADKMEAMLNADSVLNAKARSMGYEGVAVAIHSNLSPTEQERRMKAYQEGKYLAVIGDEKFKEGFDHPPMKTLFDSPRQSKVDKAQVIGRGLRKWWNELKGRYEGLTVIESFMWFANEDLDKEAQNKANAKFRTLSVKQIIGDAHIDSPDSPTYGSNGGSGGTGGGNVRLFDDDPDVEEYTTLEDLYELEAGTDELREAERLRQEALWKNNPLTLAQIKEAVDAYREANNGDNPNSQSGDIIAAILAGRISWGAISQALMTGFNGLSSDPDYKTWIATEKTPSLKNLLIHWGYEDKPFDLTVALIRETVDAYREENAGENPSGNLGLVTVGPLAGLITWAAIGQAVSSIKKRGKGGRGLSEDPEYQEWVKDEESPSLSTLLVHWGYKQKPIKLTMKDMKETVELYRKANDNKNPTMRSGEIDEGTLSEYLHWRSLDASIRNDGANGLSEDPEYQEWVKNEEETPTLSTLLTYWGYKEKPIKLTMKDMKETVELYRKANDNKNPTMRSGEIDEGKFAGRLTWMALAQSVSTGFNGLSEDDDYKTWKKTEKKPSWPKLLKHWGYKSDVTMQTLRETVEAFRLANDGKSPSNNSGRIQDGPLSGQFAWGRANEALSKSPPPSLEKDPEYIEWIKSEPKPSLFEFCKKMDVDREIANRTLQTNFDNDPAP